ncbi:MAG: deoxyguanosinetriphosphate triphosphohydrolase [Desulfobacterales bacterium]|uniref:Deoxyguanosinetriphosphate triphosphohydrolase-like protein n=1 Tax=Candidatus Desulfatibia profunda TaxID=2841695 RepID=A0A8J6TM45_9BACT|nr:deoxyguanosinetriphosphate triphosphohydrolase [Candidatus Desulfatibia profunda]MBL7179620.1 deoxyguanosinetriphosphate triphosphohydrolase [Desulfobacterales bacterium]
MSIREDFEKREKNFMAPFGCLSSQSRGRLRTEEPCPVRTAFQRDRDRIVYSNAFRRLKRKTQVFLSPLGDHYRTRLTHTLEVSEIARTIARALRLNEDLVEAIALAHDLGHPPFGHGGEMALKEIYSPDFSHHHQSLRIVDVLEKNGRGLNLTYEVRDGILKHSKGYGKIIPDNPEEMACTVEGNIVRIADIMAYLNHDLDDAVRSGVIAADQVPDTCAKVLGSTHSERATVMIKDLISSSKVHNGELRLSMSDAVFAAMAELRQFLYENVYRSPQVHNEFVKAKRILIELFTYFLNNEKMLQKELVAMEMSECNHDSQPNERIICDLIASLTDRYALDLYSKIFFPSPLF